MFHGYVSIAARAPEPKVEKKASKRRDVMWPGTMSTMTSVCVCVHLIDIYIYTYVLIYYTYIYVYIYTYVAI
jgi:hypothetical protein